MINSEEHAISMLRLVGGTATQDEVNKVKKESPEQWLQLQDWIKSVQLDAYKAGMTAAANQLCPQSTDLCYGQEANTLTRHSNKRTAELKQAILTVRDKLKELPQ